MDWKFQGNFGAYFHVLDNFIQVSQMALSSDINKQQRSKIF